MPRPTRVRENCLRPAAKSNRGRRLALGCSCLTCSGLLRVEAEELRFRRLEKGDGIEARFRGGLEPGLNCGRGGLDFGRRERVEWMGRVRHGGGELASSQRSLQYI